MSASPGPSASRKDRARSPELGCRHAVLRRVDSPADAAIFITWERNTSVGRSPKSDLYVDSPSISWNHAELTLGSEFVTLTDKSKNGTTVNGICARGKSVEVQLGAIVKFGHDVTAFVLERAVHDARKSEQDSPDTSGRIYAALAAQSVAMAAALPSAVRTHTTDRLQPVSLERAVHDPRKSEQDSPDTSGS